MFKNRHILYTPLHQSFPSYQLQKFLMQHINTPFTVLTVQKCKKHVQFKMLQTTVFLNKIALNQKIIMKNIQPIKYYLFSNQPPQLKILFPKAILKAPEVKQQYLKHAIYIIHINKSHHCLVQNKADCKYFTTDPLLYHPKALPI